MPPPEQAIAVPLNAGLLAHGRVEARGLRHRSLRVVVGVCAAGLHPQHEQERADDGHCLQEQGRRRRAGYVGEHRDAGRRPAPVR